MTTSTKDPFRVMWLSAREDQKTWDQVKHMLKQFFEAGSPILVVQFETPDTVALRKRVAELEAALGQKAKPPTGYSAVFVDEYSDEPPPGACF